MAEVQHISQNKKDFSDIKIDDVLASARGWFMFLIKRWWLIGIACLLGGIGGFFYAKQQKAKYESLLTFALEDGSGGMDGALSLAAEFGINLGGSSKSIFAGDNIISILTSRRIIEEVLLSVDTVNGKPITIAAYYQNINKSADENISTTAVNKVKFPPGQPREQFSYLQDSVLFNIHANVKKQLTVSKPDKKLNLYQVSFISLDERFTKIFTERIVQAAIQFYTQLRLKRSKDALDILSRRASSVKSSAKTAINSKAVVQDININPAQSMQNAVLQQKQLDVTANTGAYVEMFKNIEMANYQYLKDVPLLEIIDAPRYPMKKIKSGKMITAIKWSIGSFIIICIALLLFKAVIRKRH